MEQSEVYPNEHITKFDATNRYVSRELLLLLLFFFLRRKKSSYRRGSEKQKCVKLRL